MMYLRLYHGRKDPKDQMDDWGEQCNVIVELSGIIWTYGTIRLFGVDNEWEDDLLIHGGDLVEFNGVYYGDFELFTNIEEWDEYYRSQVISLKQFAELNKKPIEIK